MNRQEFMKELEGLLTVILESERIEVLQYYNDYFDDAGGENENKVIAELGTPQRVAETIQEGMNDKLQANYEFTENGFQTKNQKLANPLSTKNQKVEENWQEKEELYNSKKNKTEKRSSSTTGLLVLLVIVTFPIWIGLVAGLFGLFVGMIAVVLSIMAVLFSLLIVGVVLGVVFIVLGFCAMGFGIIEIVISPAIGISMLGGGMIMTAFGILSVIGVIGLCVVVIPAVTKGTMYLIKWPFCRKGRNQT